MTGIQFEKFIPSISFQGMAVRIIFRFFEKAIMDSIYPLVVTEAVAGAACRHPFAAQWVRKCLNLYSLVNISTPEKLDFLVETGDPPILEQGHV